MSLFSSNYVKKKIIFVLIMGTWSFFKNKIFWQSFFFKSICVNHRFCIFVHYMCYSGIWYVIWYSTLISIYISMISIYSNLLSNIVLTLYFVQINTIYEYFNDTYDVNPIYGMQSLYAVLIYCLYIYIKKHLLIAVNYIQ